MSPLGGSIVLRFSRGRRGEEGGDVDEEAVPSFGGGVEMWGVNRVLYRGAGGLCLVREPRGLWRPLLSRLLQRSPAEGLLALVPRPLPSRLAQHTGTLWGNREGCLRSEDTDLSAPLTQVAEEETPGPAGRWTRRPQGVDPATLGLARAEKTVLNWRLNVERIFRMVAVLHLKSPAEPSEGHEAPCADPTHELQRGGAQPHPSTYEFGPSGTLDQVSNPTPIKKNAIFTFNLLLVLDRND
ncbi:unnamed protein product [Arctogadus glacialis]